MFLFCFVIFYEGLQCCGSVSILVKCKAKLHIFPEYLNVLSKIFMSRTPRTDTAVNKSQYFFRFFYVYKTWGMIQTDPYLDRHRNKKSDRDPDPDRHQNDADPQHWSGAIAWVFSCFSAWCSLRFKKGKSLCIYAVHLVLV